MRSPVGGYTLIEVLLFVAISSVLLAISMVVFRGQQGHTEFISSMNDTTTKMRQWVNEVVNGSTGSQANPANSDYKCSVDRDDPSASPVLQRVASGTGAARGANPECIFLGKAIQVNDDTANAGQENRLFVYTIIGRRTYKPSGRLEKVVGDIKTARPIAAVFPPGPNPDINLTEEFKIPNGARVLSVRAEDPSGVVLSNSHLAGIFTGFNSESRATSSDSNTNTNGSLSLVGAQYPFVSNVTNSSNPSVLNCLNLTGCWGDPSTIPDNLWPMQVWRICFGSSKSDEWARITVRSTNGFGVSTQTEFGKGGVACA